MLVYSGGILTKIMLKYLSVQIYDYFVNCGYNNNMQVKHCSAIGNFWEEVLDCTPY